MATARTLGKPAATAADARWWTRPARLVARLRAWWLARLPRTDTLTLTQRNVYILPTKAGFMLGVTLLILLVASINYQLNLGYLLTFLLAGSAASGMVVGHNTLRGLTLSLAAPEPVFAGTRAALRIRLINTHRWPRRAIGIAARPGRDYAWADVAAGGESSTEISFECPQRGRHPLPTLVVETRYPLGTFRVWAPWRPAAQVLAYPAPEADPPPLPVGAPGADSQAVSRAPGVGEFDGIRAYRTGDPLKLIVWKKFAKSGELVTREALQAQRQTLWLELAHAGSGDIERRLSRLTAWVLAADALGIDYGLRLPAAEVAPGQGLAHRLRCLELLAIF